MFYIYFNIIEVISRLWKCDIERFCAMKYRTVKSRILHPVGFEPGTSCDLSVMFMTIILFILAINDYFVDADGY